MVIPWSSEYHVGSEGVLGGEMGSEWKHGWMTLMYSMNCS